LIGWCKSQGHLPAPPCPICRRNIKDTCKKIMPFDSSEVFRYTGLITISDKNLRLYKINKITEIIYNPKFDVNVSNGRRRILSELSRNKWYNTQYKDLIEYLLKKPDIVVTDDIVSELIASQNTEILALYKKHKKIPKHLKGLI